MARLFANTNQTLRNFETISFYYYYYLFKFSRSIHRLKEQTTGYRTCHILLSLVPFFETVILNNKSSTEDINS
jgi:hypothetical protein